MLFAAVAAAICAFVYVKFYHINYNQMNFAIGQCSSESPSGYYWITINLYPVGDTEYMSHDDLMLQIEQGEIETYIMGHLRWNPEIKPSGMKVWNEKNVKVIFFDKYNGDQSTITWLDDDTVVINGIQLDLPNGAFDYRRSPRD